jgi:PAS domain S-box-containing protein
MGSNEYKQLLSDVSFEALFLSKKGICIAQNKTAKEIFGYSDDEAIGQPGIQWIHPVDRDLVAKKMKEDLAKPYEVLALRKNGTTFPCEIQAKNIEFEGKRIRVTALRDITSRKTIEKELFDKITELDIITASIPNTIWKAKFNNDGKVTDVFISDSVNNLLNLAPGTIKNDWGKFFSYVLEEDLETVNEKLLEAMQNPGKIISHIYRIKKENGEIAWLSSAGYAIQNDKDHLLYGFTYEVTELKQHELALIELNATKDKLFSIISHDLKNPFTAFMGFSELMIRQIDSGNHENLRKYAEAILSGARQGSELLSNLLDWSRTQRNIVTYNPEIVEVEKFIRNVLNYFEQPARNKEIDLVYLNDGVDTFIGDRMMGETIIRNLLSNAIKFSKRKSKITLKVKADKSKTIFSIIDKGIGISQKNQKKLFNVNYNYTTQGTENEKGTGLGLALSKEFVDFHKGEIGVKSEPFKGSEFWFTIPKK